jgi:hypothetical protein
MPRGIKRLERSIEARFKQFEERFDRVDQRFDRVDQRFDRVDQRFDQVDQRFNQVDQRFSQVDAELHKHGLLLESMNNDLKQTMETVEGNREAMDRKFAEVLRTIDQRVQPIELAVKGLSRQVADRGHRKPPRRKAPA